MDLDPSKITPIPLSPRMKAVLVLLSQGHTYKGVAVALSMRRDTVRKYAYRAADRLGARTVTQAVVIFIAGHADDVILNGESA